MTHCDNCNAPSGATGGLIEVAPGTSEEAPHFSGYYCNDCADDMVSDERWPRDVDTRFGGRIVQEDDPDAEVNAYLGSEECLRDEARDDAINIQRRARLGGRPWWRSTWLDAPEATR